MTIRTRFDGLGKDYARFRPVYPPSLLRRMQVLLAQAKFASPLWIDVGCGTGIFTRQVADMLPVGFRLIGLEPSADMRGKAQRATPEAAVEYRDGTAEALPVQDGTVSVVSAATAAHWFDRPRFYTEAARVLSSGGLLLIVQYVRDLETSPIAAALEAYLRETGGPKAYDRPDYAVELAEAPGFEPADAWSSVETLPLSQNAFIGLALSSSHAAASVERKGLEEVRRDLGRIAEANSAPDGTVLFGYRFDLVAARKDGHWLKRVDA